jgi:hypothetical protein
LGLSVSHASEKGDEVVGEEVRDPSRIEDLAQANVCFLQNFVYKDKVDFHWDIVEKVLL